MSLLFPPVPQFGGPDGLPLNGQIYAGEAGQDARSNPITVYWDEDLTIPAQQPIRVLGGYPLYQGAARRLYMADVTCSVTILTLRGELVMENVIGGLDALIIGFLQTGADAVPRSVGDRLRDWVSVFDFMSATQIDDVRSGTDAVDVTSAIQAAADAHLSIHFPLGTYRISDTLTFRDGTRIDAFGATLHQTTDNTSLIDISGVEDVCIRGMHFQDTGSGYIDSDAQPHAAILGAEGTDKLRVFGCRFTEITFAAIRLRGSDDVDISHNTLVGPGSGVLAPSSNLRCYPILVDALSTNFRLGFNDISEALHGMRIGRSSGGTILGNVIHDIPAQHGAYIGPECNDLSISSNVFRDIELQAIKVQAENAYTHNVNISITSNVITTCDQGITVSNAAGGTAQAVQNHNVVIANNTILDCVDTGINVQNAVNAQVTDNMLEDIGGPGINFSACDYLTIATNRLVNVGDSGIRDQSPCTNVAIKGNNLHNVALNNTASDNYGIFVQDMDGGYSFCGNRTTSAAGGMLHSLYCTGSTQATTVIEGNEFYGATGQALRCAGSGSAFALFKDNILEGTTGAAFNNPALPSVASAASLTLPTQHDVITVTGTTGITSIDASGHTGHRVTLKFDGALTVTRGGVLVLNQALGNFVTTANDTLTLVCDGSNWLEVSRSAN